MYYTTKEVAKILKYTDETIRKKIRKGEISAFKVRDKLRISEDEVKRYLGSTIKIDNITLEEKNEIINELIKNSL